MGKTLKTANNLSKDELLLKINELESQLFKLIIQKGTGQLANTALIKQTRHELARVRTFMTQKGHG